MIRNALALCAALLLSISPAHAVDAKLANPPLSAADEGAVKALTGSFVDAWNRHDMKALHDIDTDDVQWLNVVGHSWVGKTTVYRGHSAFHKRIASHSTVRIEQLDIRPLAPGVAVAVAVMHFRDVPGPDGQAAGPVTKTRASFIAVKRQGSWKIGHFQNTAIEPRFENDDLPNWPEAESPPVAGK
ncbi:SgcJ/EcaC family oxidoreductase [Roseateles sp.]|uniref:SgcJ/EcaC family oxidoreductase n=1 Tax=Roseateles sp. TaxID=1971397 RepID=UPI003262F926